MTRILTISLLISVMSTLLACASTGSPANEIDADADKAVAQFITEVDGAEEYLNQVPGYLVFPSVVKVGLTVGGESGKGALRVGGRSIAYYRMSSGSVGLQLGIQSKSVIIAFQTAAALEQFSQSSGWQAGVDGAIVVANVGGGLSLKDDSFTDPIAAFVFGEKGFMYNLTLEGTNFTRLWGLGSTSTPSLPASYYSTGAAPGSEESAIAEYFPNRKLDEIEGLWLAGDSSFLIAVIRNNSGMYPAYDYLGVVVRTNVPLYSNSWKPGQIKLFIKASAERSVFTGANYGPTHILTNSPYVLDGPNLLRTSVLDTSTYRQVETMFVRQYPMMATASSPNNNVSESRGTCFLISPTGTAVTSQHVVDDAREVLVELTDGRRLRAKIAAQSSANDIAILDLATDTPDYLGFAPAKSIQLGDEIFTIGYPTTDLLGSDPKFTDGTISALSGLHGDTTYLQISAPVQPGSSGGPVVNMGGEVVGVIFASAADGPYFRATGSLPQNVNWAVKSEYVQPMIETNSARARAASRGEAIRRVQKSVCQVIAKR